METLVVAVHVVVSEASNKGGLKVFECLSEILTIHASNLYGRDVFKRREETTGIVNHFKQVVDVDYMLMTNLYEAVVNV